MRPQTFSWETSSNDVELAKLRSVNEEQFEVPRLVGEEAWSRLAAEKLRELEKETGIYEYNTEKEKVIFRRVEIGSYFSFKFNPKLTGRSEGEDLPGCETSTTEEASS
jgi:hypothetical protein